MPSIFAFFRYGFHGLQSDLSPEELAAILRSADVVTMGKTEWAVGNVEVVEVGSTRFVVGLLGASERTAGIEFNRTTHTFEQTDSTSSFDALSRFFIVPEAHIAIGEYKPAIRSDLFARRLRLLMLNSPEFPIADIEIDAIIQEHAFMREVEALTTVSSARFKLRPSNPNNRDLWRDQDEDLKRMNAEDELRLIKAKKGKSLQIEGTTLKSAIAQVEDGYGQGKVVGEQDGHKAVIVSGKRPLTYEAETDDFLSEYLLGEVNRIQQRMDH